MFSLRNHVWLFLSLFVTFLVVQDVAGYKILVYNPRLGRSHTMFSGKIADILAAAGHEVVVYQPLIDPDVKTSGSKNKTIRYYNLDATKEENPFADKKKDFIWEDDTSFKMFGMLNMMYKMRVLYCELLMKDDANHQLLKAEKFDLGFLEDFESCGLGVFEKIGLDKYIVTHSSGMYPVVGMYAGAVRVPSISPTIFSGNTDRMTFGQRIGNFLGMFMEDYVWKQMMTSGPNEVIRRHFPNFDIDEKIQNAAFLFINADEHVDYTLPITSKVVYIGGMSTESDTPSKKTALEAKYLDIFNSAKDGVVLISFGSNARSADMPAALKTHFLNMFKQFPDVNFIWKYEEDLHEIAKGLPNVFTSNWLPQNEILAHPKLIGFVTHGGQNSLTESATAGVPTICIPLFADQHHNCMILKKRGIGQVILKHKVDEDNLIQAIGNFVNDKSYEKNANLLAKMVRSKPTTANERILKYATFAAQFGNTGTLISETKNLTWYQLYSVDVILFLLAVVAAVVYGFVFVTKKLIKKVCGNTVDVNKKTN